MIKIDFLCHRRPFLVRACEFSRTLGCGAYKGPTSTPRRKCGSRPAFVARALRSKSRENWQIITGLLSTEPGPSRPMETPNCNNFFHHFTISWFALLLFLSTIALRLCTHGTTASVLQPFPFITSHERRFTCACVWSS